MKINRLIGIITTLQQKKAVTAPYLAKKFEVSRRTINRDIEDICKAGIPIVTTQGANGGISIMDGFSLDTTVFTKQELTAIFTGLKSLDSVSNSASAEKLAQKIGGSSAIRLADSMVIDLSSFYKDDLAAKIDQIKQAITESKCIAFHYCYNKGEADKQIEPYLIVFKWSDWYVFGFCKERQDFRMYKLRRLWNLQVVDESFTIREIPEEKKQFGSHITDDYVITAVYDASVKYRLVDEYGHNSFTEMEDGKLYTEWGFTTQKGAVEWFLSFGNKVKVLGPPEMVEIMKSTLDSIKNLYES
ncbi:helix-turn-helix transcriptional regulator [Hydrogeniiclostridium mannosilyticum]|uniref:helix-turn-helix transcriptional regulator n=1 Tax=Hydrogeniiclostridium mannosilyticum TaxID=2764322 RepID=UPI0018AB837C|nr:YafY family protein [Hydrogeniiclostridium mannosilyticum]